MSYDNEGEARDGSIGSTGYETHKPSLCMTDQAPSLLATRT